MPWNRPVFAAAVIAFVSLGGPAALMPAAIAADAPPQRYDIRDLLHSVPDFSVDRAAVAPKPVDPAARDRQLAAAGESLAAIVHGVLPKGADVRFDAKAGELIVTGNSDAQDTAKRVIARVRTDRARQIVTTARVVRVNDAFLAALPNDLRVRVAAAAFDHGRHPAELDDIDANLIVVKLSAAHADADPGGNHGAASVVAGDGTQLTMPRLTTFNGQKAFVAVTTDTNYVDAVNPAADGAAGFAPHVATVQSGVTADVHARTAADGASVAVELGLNLTRLLSLDTVRQEHGTAIQKPRTHTDRVTGLYLVPAGKTLLIRPDGVADETQSHVIVLLKADVVPAAAAE